MHLPSFLITTLTTSLLLHAALPAQATAAFVLDRSGSMGTLRSTGSPRAADCVVAATGDIGTFFFINSLLGLNPQAVVFEFHGTTATQLGGVHTTAASAVAALNTVPAPSGTTPLAAAICQAKDALIALAPNADPTQRSIYVYSDGEENSSPVTSCRAGLPDATSGERCAQQFGSVPAFSSGSWQEAICNLIHAQIQLNVYYFADFQDLVGAQTFFRAVTNVTGGTFYQLDDQSTAPVTNPWRVFGQGCRDFHAFPLSMDYDGTPQLGNTVFVGCRTSAPFPYLLAVGFQNSVGGVPIVASLAPLGAPGCFLYSTSDLIEGFHGYGTRATIAIPTNTNLVGTRLSFQGGHLHVLNNPLGLATSNLLEMTIQP